MRRISSILLCVGMALAAFGLAVAVAGAQPLAPQGTLTSPAAVAQDLLGESVAISGDTAIVGVRGRTVNGYESAGAAYVYTRTGGVWSIEQTLTADVPASGDQFGVAVAISGDTALVGSASHVAVNHHAGTVTVFKRTGSVWTQSQELYSPSATTDDAFGQAVAVQGDTALVGAMYHGTPGNVAGAVYAFSRSGGGEFGGSQELTGTDVINNEWFGSAVSLDGDTAVIGAQRHNHVGNGLGSGGAFVFTRSAGVWTAQQELLVGSTDYLNASDSFGSAVAVSGDTAVIGARAHWHLGQQTGAAYVFSRSGATWTKQQALFPSDGANYDSFGASLAVSDDTALVGAWGHDHAGSPGGACYVFSRSGPAWTQGIEFAVAGSGANDGFGQSVFLSDDSAIVGAPGRQVDGKTSAGAAFVFLRSAIESAPVVDTTPPGPATSLVGTPGYTSAVLSWANPASDYSLTLVLRSTTGYATTATVVPGQTTVFEASGTSCPDISLTPGKRYYYTVYERDAAGNWSTAATVSVVPQSYATLGKPSLKPTSPTHGKSFKVTGTISPKHSSKATLRLYFFRKVGGVYTAYKSIGVTVSAHAGSYSKSVTLPAKGAYYVKAYHADTAHAGKYSASRTFTVK
jgi:hypothetical protein